MKKMIKNSLLLIAFVSLAVSMQAQKFGYLNSQAILASMPAVKQMQANLETLQKQLQKKGEGMVAAYQQQEQAAMQKKEQGTLSPKDEEILLKELQTKQQELMEFEQNMKKQLVEKEQKLLEPILAQINTAINDVAKESSFTMIFDASTGILLFADEALDVGDQVKAKLGI